MTDAEDDRAAAFRPAVDDAYRALGRYFYEFSRLIFHMRMELRSIVANGEVDLLLARAAQEIANSYFGACRAFGDLSADEQAVFNALRKQVNEVIATRNDLAHGEWWIGWGTADASEPDDPIAVRYNPIRTAGTTYTIEHPVQDLDALSNGIVLLRPLVKELGVLCLRSPVKPLVFPGRLSDYMRIEDGRVVHWGPGGAVQAQ